MKATEAKLLEFLKKSPQFVIPIYQRTYSWTERECSQLWDDVLRTGRNDDVAAHFVGSIVYIEKGLYQVSSQSPLLVIDGQQRLTTVMLILEALARHLGDSEPLDGFSARKLRSYYLLNPLEEGDRAFKLLLTQTDKASLIALVVQKAMPAESSLRVQENFEVFMVDIAGVKEPVRVTHSDGFDGLPVPSPDGTQIAWTSSRGGGREGQIFLAQWNHEAARAALARAPQRK